MNDIFENVVTLYKEKKFTELKKKIDELNKEDEVNLKLMILANSLISNNREDYSEELSDLSSYIVKSGIPINNKIIFPNPKDETKNEECGIAYMAVMSGDLNTLKAAIEVGANINELHNGASLLFYSVCLKDEKISNYLIDNGIEIMPYQDHPSIINVALATNQVDIVKKLLNHHYDFNKESIYSEDPVLLALKYSNELAELILNSHFKFKLRSNSNIITPIEAFALVAENIDVKMFDKIMKKIKTDLIEINYPILNTIPAIHILIGKNLIDHLEVLLELGLDVNTRVVLKDSVSVVFNQRNISGYTPLMYAVFAGYYKIVDLLVKYNADPNIKDLLSNSPIEIAKISNQETFISLVKSPKLNLDVNIGNNSKDYLNPIHFLSQLKGESAAIAMGEILKRSDIKELINKPVSQSAESEINQFTPLMLACSVKNTLMILEMLKFDFIDLNYHTSKGERAIFELLTSKLSEEDDVTDIASNVENMKLLEQLEEDDYKLKLKKEKNNTLEIAKVMIDKGAEIDFKVENKKMVKLLEGENKEFIKNILSENKQGLFKRIFN